MTEPNKNSIKDWWAACPMTYGTLHGEASYGRDEGVVETLPLGTREFFERLDQTFYRWTVPLHTERGYFARIFPYERYGDRRVLELGCGLGTMAMNWARHGARVTAVDLNPVAVTQTAQRFKLLGIPGRLAQADATQLPLKDAAFDYVYSWGVLHHSPDLVRSLRELVRVLRPGGEFGVMLYHRRSLRYGYIIRYVEGFLSGESRFLNALGLASRYTDGIEGEGNPHTWPVSRREIGTFLAPHADRLTMEAFGEELDDIFPYMLPGIGRWIPRAVKNVWARRFGWSLWITGVKKPR